jgi:hypothetical protein
MSFDQLSFLGIIYGLKILKQPNYLNFKSGTSKVSRICHFNKGPIGTTKNNYKESHSSNILKKSNP